MFGQFPNSPYLCIRFPKGTAQKDLCIRFPKGTAQKDEH